jgi:DNA-binding response OmpR family regulator
MMRKGVTCGGRSVQEESAKDIYSGAKVTGEGVNPHILFVDDDPKLCELLALYFEAKGLGVTTATTGAEARMLIDTTPFSLAILDVNLDGESGLDLLDLIKRKTPALPVLMFTGLDADEDLVRKTLRGRAEGIVHKTGSLEGILTAVRWQLAKTT